MTIVWQRPAHRQRSSPAHVVRRVDGVDVQRCFFVGRGSVPVVLADVTEFTEHGVPYGRLCHLCASTWNRAAVRGWVQVGSVLQLKGAST